MTIAVLRNTALTKINSCSFSAVLSLFHTLSPSAVSACSPMCVYVCLSRQAKFSFTVLGQCVTVPWPWCWRVLTISEWRGRKKKRNSFPPPLKTDATDSLVKHGDGDSLCMAVIINPAHGRQNQEKDARISLGCWFKSLPAHNREA